MKIEKILHRQELDLQRQLDAVKQRRELLNKLDAERQEIEASIASGNVSTSRTSSGNAKSSGKRKDRVFERGVLSFAVLDSMGRGAQSVSEIVEKVKAHPFIKGKSVPDLDDRITNLVNTSAQLERLGNARFKSKGIPNTTLFNNLKARKSELVAA
jgi:hypothetical protein